MVHADPVVSRPLKITGIVAGTDVTFTPQMPFNVPRAVRIELPNCAAMVDDSSTPLMLNPVTLVPTPATSFNCRWNAHCDPCTAGICGTGGTGRLE